MTVVADGLTDSRKSADCEWDGLRRHIYTLASIKFELWITQSLLLLGSRRAAGNVRSSTSPDAA